MLIRVHIQNVKLFFIILLQIWGLKYADVYTFEGGVLKSVCETLTFLESP